MPSSKLLRISAYSASEAVSSQTTDVIHTYLHIILRNLTLANYNCENGSEQKCFSWGPLSLTKIILPFFTPTYL